MLTHKPLQPTRAHARRSSRNALASHVERAPCLNPRRALPAPLGRRIDARHPSSHPPSRRRTLL